MKNILLRKKNIEILATTVIIILFGINPSDLFQLFLGFIYLTYSSLINFKTISDENRVHLSWMTLLIGFSEFTSIFYIKIILIGLVPLSLLLRFFSTNSFKTFQSIFIIDLITFTITGYLFFNGHDAYGFIALLFSVAIRSAQFPFNYWIKKSAYSTDIFPSILFFMVSQTGLLLFSKASMLNNINTTHISMITYITLFTGLLTSIGALRNSDFLLRHLLLIASQSCLPLSAFFTNDSTTATGGVLFGITIGLGGTISGFILYQIYLQKNIRTLDRFYSLYRENKNLALFYLISGMSIVGMPFTIGYIAEDILFHGLVTYHPILASIYILITALNAFNIFKIFNFLFFGHTITTPTALYFSKINKFIIGCSITFIVSSLFVAGPLSKFIENNLNIIFIK